MRRAPGTSNIYLYTFLTYTKKTVCDQNHGSLHFLSIRRGKYNKKIMIRQANRQLFLCPGEF